MEKKKQWPEGHLLSVKLRDDLYTIAQRSRPLFMRFFKVARRDGRWQRLELDTIPVLFTVPVLLSAPGALAGGEVDASVAPNTTPFERYWLKANPEPGSSDAFEGASLVESRERELARSWPVVKELVSLATEGDLVRRCEFTRTTNSTDLKQRLTHYFDTGRDLDPFKLKVFKVGPEVLYSGPPDPVMLLDTAGGPSTRPASGTSGATVAQRAQRPVRRQAPTPPATDMLSSRSSAKRFAALIAQLDPAVRDLAEGRVPHPAFRDRCGATDRPKVEHGGEQPPGPPFLTLWEFGDQVTGVREKGGKLEFLTFDIEDPLAYTVVAHTSRGLLAHVFFELASDQDWRDEAKARGELHSAAAAVSFREVDEVIRIYRSRGWKPDEFLPYTRAL
jgi:hypothetical protein